MIAPENRGMKSVRPAIRSPKIGICRIACDRRNPSFSTTPEIRPVTAAIATPARPANTPPTTFNTFGSVNTPVMVRPSFWPTSLTRRRNPSANDLPSKNWAK